MGGLCSCGCGGKAPIAKATKSIAGHVKGRPMKYIKGHQNYRRARDVRSVFEDLSYPDPNSGCFVWAGTTRPDGYALFSVKGRSILAARVAWELANGPVPKGMEIRHKCHQRFCVNPDHLQLGTHAQNMADMVLARRGRRGGLPYGVKKQNGRGWIGRVCLPGQKGRTVHLGTFDTIEDAAAAVEQRRAELLRSYGAAGEPV